MANARKCLISAVRSSPKSFEGWTCRSARRTHRLEKKDRGDFRIELHETPSANGRTALVPASPSVEAATADQKHDDNDDQKGGHIHDDVPLARRLAQHPDEVVARLDASRVDYFFKASRRASLAPPTAL